MANTHRAGALNSWVLTALAWCALSSFAAAQTDTGGAEAVSKLDSKNNTEAAMVRLKSGNLLLPDIDRIAEAGMVEAIPEFEKQFSVSEDEDKREALASALVRLGDRSSAYWDYLWKEATLAVDNKAPSIARYDANGKFVPGPSPEFVAWSQAQHLSIQSATTAAMRQLPSKVLFLAATRDRRAIPLLRKALSSNNFMAQTFAAQGLARLQDHESIPLIIAACQKAPADVAMLIAQKSLMIFDDPQAKLAANAFLPRKPPDGN